MKNSIFPIDLVVVTSGKDSLNQVVEASRTTKSIFADISSVSQTEFFSAGRIGLQPSLKAVIYDFEYEGEPIVKWNNKLYSVYRTYAVPGTDKLELYLEEKEGTKDEPDPDDNSSEHSDG